MDQRVDFGPMMDVSTTSFTPVNSGAIGSVAPIVSAWQKVKGLESIVAQLTAAGGANIVWTVQVSNDDAATKVAIETASMPNQPTYPTGVNGSSSPVIPTWGYKYLRLTATPQIVAGSVTATFNGKMTSRPVDLAQDHHGSVFLYVPAADTLAGQFALEASNDWSGIFGRPKGNALVLADGQWADPKPIAIPALVASTGQKTLVNLGLTTEGASGIIHYGALRVLFTPTAGFGNPQAFGMFKAA